jgi:transcriptional regulator with GAF, ATPase, and Fis domain
MTVVGKFSEEREMNENKFFREAVLRICGNLDIEVALNELLQLLKGVMPVTTLFIQVYDRGYNAMRTIAFANQKEYGVLDQLTPLSKTAQESIAKVPTINDILIFEDPYKFAISMEMLQFHKIEATSLMVMMIRSKNAILGSLVLINEGDQNFTPKHFNQVPLLKEPMAIALSNTLKHREVLKLKELLVDDNRYLFRELRRLSGDEIIGANFGLRDVMEKVRQVAVLNSSVLLMGETGVGKDVIANAIHYSSSRKDGPFVSVNCGAIPDSLIDSELFGHEKGAFTGAFSQKRGRFERAQKGTIFLDEISELPLQAQVRFLNVLQNREIERIGGTKKIALDIRIIAATNRNLHEMVIDKEFREDLWFRLNVFPIYIPPLRSRKSDIQALVQHFIHKKVKELKLAHIPTLAPSAIDCLLSYDWPGNVRELENVVERALILNPNGPICFENLLVMQPQKEETSMFDSDNLDEVTRQHIRNILVKVKGKIHGKDGAAELLGINASTLRNRMKKLGIEYGRTAKVY